MNEQTYEYYIKLINRRYRYNNTNMKRRDLTLKLLSWCYKGGIVE